MYYASRASPNLPSGRSLRESLTLTFLSHRGERFAVLLTIGKRRERVERSRKKIENMDDQLPPPLGLVQILEAEERIRGHVHRTPVLTCASLSRSAGRQQVFLKAECLQKTGSFKARGACNALRRLTEDRPSLAVLTHSSGNHGQALAWAAKLCGVKAKVVVPRTTTPSKVEAIESYGAEIIYCEPSLVDRERTVEEILKGQQPMGKQVHFVHPSNDKLIIAGQGTVGVEIMEQVRELLVKGQRLHAIVAPIGGGGLISGVALAAKSMDPRIRIIGAEPAAADDAFRSLQTGQLLGHPGGATPNTIAEGLLTTLGSITWPIVRDNVDGIITVREEEIQQAMRMVFQRVKLVIEPAAAVGVAAIMSTEFQRLVPGDGCVAVVLCGGNANIQSLFGGK
jgi:threonine dehydratase